MSLLLAVLIQIYRGENATHFLEQLSQKLSPPVSVPSIQWEAILPLQVEARPGAHVLLLLLTTDKEANNTASISSRVIDLRPSLPSDLDCSSTNHNASIAAFTYTWSQRPQNDASATIFAQVFQMLTTWCDHEFGRYSLASLDTQRKDAENKIFVQVPPLQASSDAALVTVVIKTLGRASILDAIR
jgi:hypothetical protein